MHQRLAGLNLSVRIASRKSPDYCSILHLAVQSVLCTRPLVVLIKDLIADTDCVNWKNSNGKTAYDLLQENNDLIASSDKEKTLSLGSFSVNFQTISGLLSIDLGLTCRLNPSRILKPSSVANALGAKADELEKWRLSLLKTEKAIFKLSAVPFFIRFY